MYTGNGPLPAGLYTNAMSSTPRLWYWTMSPFGPSATAVAAGGAARRAEELDRELGGLRRVDVPARMPDRLHVRLAVEQRAAGAAILARVGRRVGALLFGDREAGDRRRDERIGL